MSEIRRYLEPGSVVLASPAWKGNTNIMTIGWHMVLEFSLGVFDSRPDQHFACRISHRTHQP
jgi:hypothetical protein